jgi:hypothetical protein
VGSDYRKVKIREHSHTLPIDFSIAIRIVEKAQANLREVIPFLPSIGTKSPKAVIDLEPPGKVINKINHIGMMRDNNSLMIQNRD